jgi:hypothetical protein
VRNWSFCGSTRLRRKDCWMPRYVRRLATVWGCCHGCKSPDISRHSAIFSPQPCWPAKRPISHASSLWFWVIYYVPYVHPLRGTILTYFERIAISIYLLKYISPHTVASLRTYLGIQQSFLLSRVDPQKDQFRTRPPFFMRISGLHLPFGLCWCLPWYIRTP